MKDAWKTFENRLGNIETQQSKQVGEMASMAGRIKITEKEALTEDVKKLKVQLEEKSARTAEYRLALSRCHMVVNKDRKIHKGGDVLGSARGDPDALSPEDQKTLIVGGWMQDTRRSVIETEANDVLKLPEVAPLLDTDKISVFGPRRSVGMIRFTEREGETMKDVKERMWQVIKIVAKAKIVFASTQNLGENRTAWVAFVKTRTARTRTAHISMIRRVTMALAAEVKDEGGGVLNIDHTLVVSYDMDWGAGTLWCGPQKLGSSTHRPPHEAEIVKMTGGWVKLDAVSLVAGCNVDVAKSAFERELCQEIKLLDMAAADMDIVIVQEIARGEEGLGIGISTDKFDCVINKVVIGSLHCLTGVTNAKYQVPTWVEADDDEVVPGVEVIASGSSNLNTVVDQAATLGMRQIDMLWVRSLDATRVVVEPDRRFLIGTDHALIAFDLLVNQRARVEWGNDSRPRWVSRQLPDDVIEHAEDIAHLAKTRTAPRSSKAYKDDDEVKQAFHEARRVKCDTKLWKAAHKLRKLKRKEWQDARVTSILNGDWSQYRAMQKEKQRHRGWWGGLLQDRSSADLTKDVQEHLEAKLVNEAMMDWDEMLETHINNVDLGDIFVPFTILDVRTVLQDMKPSGAVGPDGVSVSLLKEIANNDTLGPQMVNLINGIVEHTEIPSSWNENFLALLAKINQPKAPKDMRPICVSSVFHKLVTKLVCCGKGRQAADVIGAFDRLDRLKVVEFLKAHLNGTTLPHELRYLLAQLRSYCLSGKVPGGGTIHIKPNVGIKQGAPESAELFGLVMDTLLMRLLESRGWRNFGHIGGGLEIDLVFYQDDLFLFEDDFVRLCKRIKVLERLLEQAGLKLATNKTKIVASEHYRGARRAKVGGDIFQIAPAHESLKVLGNYSVEQGVLRNNIVIYFEV
ncbi:pol, partial [Symbiodinium necroappetens]